MSWTKPHPLHGDKNALEVHHDDGSVELTGANGGHYSWIVPPKPTSLTSHPLHDQNPQTGANPTPKPSSSKPPVSSTTAAGVATGAAGAAAGAAKKVTKVARTVRTKVASVRSGGAPPAPQSSLPDSVQKRVDTIRSKYEENQRELERVREQLRNEGGHGNEDLIQKEKDLQAKQKSLERQAKSAGIKTESGAPDFNDTSGTQAKVKTIESDWKKNQKALRAAENKVTPGKQVGMTGTERQEAQREVDRLEREQKKILNRARASGVDIEEGVPKFGGAVGDAAGSAAREGESVAGKVARIGGRVAKSGVTRTIVEGAGEAIYGGIVPLAGLAGRDKRIVGEVYDPRVKRNVPVWNLNGKLYEASTVAARGVDSTPLASNRVITRNDGSKATVSQVLSGGSSSSSTASSPSSSASSSGGSSGGGSSSSVGLPKVPHTKGPLPESNLNVKSVSHGTVNDNQGKPVPVTYIHYKDGRTVTVGPDGTIYNRDNNFDQPSGPSRPEEQNPRIGVHSDANVVGTWTEKKYDSKYGTVTVTYKKYLDGTVIGYGPDGSIYDQSHTAAHGTVAGAASAPAPVSTPASVKKTEATAKKSSEAAAEADKKVALAQQKLINAKATKAAATTGELVDKAQHLINEAQKTVDKAAAVLAGPGLLSSP